MTSRTTPVGAVVLAFAGLLAVGCTAQTAAVFNALTDPATVPASPTDVEASSDGSSTEAATQSWWSHPDGYAMTLPAGWSGVVVSRAQAARLIEAIDSSHPGVVDRIEATLGTTKSRVSAVAAQVSEASGVSPLLLVIAQPTEGRRARGVKTRVHEQIAALPGLQGSPARTDVRLPAGSGVRFEYMIVDPDLGTLRVYSYLFRFGSQAYLVNFVASADVFDDDAEALFEAIAESLRFGV